MLHLCKRNGVCVSRGNGEVLSLRVLRCRQPQPNHRNVRLPSPKVRQTDILRDSISCAPAISASVNYRVSNPTKLKTMLKAQLQDFTRYNQGIRKTIPRIRSKVPADPQITFIK